MLNAFNVLTVLIVLFVLSDSLEISAVPVQLDTLEPTVTSAQWATTKSLMDTVSPAPT